MPKDYEKKYKVYIIKFIFTECTYCTMVEFKSNGELNNGSKQFLSAYTSTNNYTTLILTTVLQNRFYYYFRDEEPKSQRNYLRK